MKVELSLDELDYIFTALEHEIFNERVRKGLISERDFYGFGLIEKLRSIIEQHPQNT